jgi:hypothetical protein
MKLAERVLNKMEEMATVGKFDKYKVTVYHEPLMQKSYHLSWDEYEVVLNYPDNSILEIKKLPNNMSNLKKGDFLPQSIMKDVEKFMKEKNKKQPTLTNKKALEFAWKLLNEDL